MIELPSRRLPYSKSSAIAQTGHVRLVLAEVALTVAIAAIALSIAVVPSTSAAPLGFTAVLVLFVLSVVVRLYAGSAQLDRRWYTYRAVAESMKTLSWQYAAGAGEFPLEDAAAEGGLRNRLNQIASYSRFPPYPDTVSEGVSASIPRSLTELRAKPWTQRRDIYLVERVDDQIKWYRSKGQKNAARSTIFSRTVIGLQVIGVILAIILLSKNSPQTLGVGVVAFLAVLISSSIAWTQVRQYSELVEPYLNALNELTQLRAEIAATSTEPQFLEAITQAELAISREHTSWLAKRGMHAGVGA
jgi:hypothetical protein